MVAKRRTLSPMPLLDEDLVLEHTRELGINDKHVFRMWRHIIHKGVTNVRDIDQLPKSLYKLVEEKFALTTSKIVKEETSSDNSTTKLLLEMQDGARIETVIMRYGRFDLKNFPSELKKTSESGETAFRSKERATVCVSSQVGCQMGCTFCATGTMGLMSNLTAGEIMEQLYHAFKFERATNVVFMGMGEPLDNYDCVRMAIKGMIDVQRFSLSPNKISISTVGVVPRMKDMAEDMPEVGMALSLHAPTQELRCEIVPTGKAWHIDKILEAMDHFQAVRSSLSRKKTHVLVEYVLIDNVNSSLEVAHQLGEILKGREVLLNVIPYNPTDVPHDYRPPSRETTDAFLDAVRSHGVKTLIRQELGQDVNAACGQLAVKSQGKCGDDVDLEDIGGTRRRKVKTKAAAKVKAQKTQAVEGATQSKTSLLSGRMERLFVLLALVFLVRLLYKFIK